jgi:hypothetical protein
MDRRQFIAGLAALGLVAALPAIAGAEAPAPDVIRKPESPCFWQTVRWDDMSEAEQALWRILGWSPENWESTDESDYPESELKTFKGLAPAERDAVEALGYREETWDNIDSFCGSGD